LREGRRADLRGQRIGFVFQEYNLLPTLSVLENVLLPLSHAKGAFKDGRARAIRLLESVGLGDRLNRRPDQLSGGQQQRVVIAHALINRPALVLADEPTGALATQTGQEPVGLMRKLNLEEDVTFVLVTHDLDLAAATDRMIRLKDGRVVSDEMVTERRQAA
jgi:putative ABC transport system ATP-binding protein